MSIRPSLVRSAFRAVALPAAALLLASGAATAQPSVSATVGTSVDTLAPTGVASETHAAPMVSAGFEHLFADERVRLFYELDAGTFATPGDWQYQVHNAGASWKVPFADGSRRLFIGGSAWWRANGDSWAAADYRGASAFTNIEWQLSPTAILRAGYRFDARQFPDLAELDQLQHTGFASVLVNLPSRTTIIAEGYVGAKSYEGGVTLLASPHDPATLTATPAGSTARGRGPGMGAGMQTLSNWTQVNNPGSTARQFTIFGRVAQSLADRTSVSVQASRRGTGGGLPPTLVATPELFFDDGVYDDPFASEATEWRAAVKHVAGNGAVFEAGGGRVLKDYTGTPALDPEGLVLEGAPLRSDRVWRGDARLTWPIFTGHTGPVELGVTTGYLFTKHESNTSFYNYTSHRVSLGLTIEY